MTPYDREAFVNALVYHQRKNIESCYCGWAKLGASHAEHVADVYEAAVRHRPSSTGGARIVDHT